MSIAEIAIGTSFSGPVTDVLGNAKGFLVVLYCSLDVAERVISIAETSIGLSFSCAVAYVLGNAKVFLVVLYCSLEVAERHTGESDKHCRDCNRYVLLRPCRRRPWQCLCLSRGTLLLVGSRRETDKHCRDRKRLVLLQTCCYFVWLLKDTP